MRYSHLLTDLSALELPDQVSQARELYLEKQTEVKVQVNMDFEEALPLFHQLPMNVLPPLPIGHQWVVHNGKYSVIRDKNAIEKDLSLTLFGPSLSATPHINFLCRVDGVTTYSFTKALKGKGPASRKYPMQAKDFHVDGYDYRPGVTFQNHMRGHLGDHQDTIIRRFLTPSTQCSSNFIPEPPIDAWGKFFRNQKVKIVRSLEGYYAQYNEYDDVKNLTVNDTMVPTHARFYTFDRHYGFNDVHHVSWTENLERANPALTYVENYQQQFASSELASPIVKAYEPAMTDRDLRGLRRGTLKDLNQIIGGAAKSRFSIHDQAHTAAKAANIEVTSSNCLPLSARKLFDVTRSDRVTVSVHEMQRSLYHMSKLQELSSSTVSSVYSENTRQQSLMFFDELKKIEHDKTDVERLVDEFKQNCSM